MPIYQRPSCPKCGTPDDVRLVKTIPNLLKLVIGTVIVAIIGIGPTSLAWVCTRDKTKFRASGN